MENESALAVLPSRLAELDAMPESRRSVELITALLAGNMFDWGAKESMVLMEAGNFGLEQAKEKLPGVYDCSEYNT